MEDKSLVERLKSALYSRSSKVGADPLARTPLSPRPDIRLPEASSASPKGEAAPDPLPPIERMARAAQPRRERPFALYFLGGSLAFFLIAGGIALYAFFGGVNTISPENIDLQVIAPSLVDSGKEINLQYLIDNRNNAGLHAADLIIDYPDGTRDPKDPTQALAHERIPVGDISAGQQLKLSSSAVFFGGEGMQEKVGVTLEYQLNGSNAIFVRQTSVLFTIGSSPVGVSVSAPDEAISGQPFDMDVTVSSNATSPLGNVALQIVPPFGFALESASPAADIGGTLWHLGNLKPGESQVVHITGTLTGEDGDQRVFHFLAGTESDPTETSLAVPLLSQPETVTIHKPFVSAQLALDGATGTTVPEPLGKSVQGTIAWQNNLQETVSNLSFTLSLQGSGLDPSSVQASNAFYDSNKGTITWSPDQDSSLASVPPGASGTLQFNFSTVNPSAALINPSLRLNLTVHAVRQGDSGAPQEVTSAAAVTVALSSAVSLSAQALHFTGPFQDGGMVPPKVGQATQYTVLWTVKNSSNTIAQSQVTTTLPPYVDFVQSSDPSLTYDKASRTVTWDLGDLRAGAGFGQPDREAAFQVTLTPSLSQAGQGPALTGAAQFTGEDRFAQASVTAQASAVTTVLSEGQFQRGMELVGQ